MGDIITEKEGAVFTIRFNRPKKKNALTSQMFLDFQQHLNNAASDDDITIVLVTGTGDYFTSGNDLTNFTEGGLSDTGNLDTLAKNGRDGFYRFVELLIDFPKILAAVVNGSAVGIGVTMLGLFDIVFAVEKADFVAPFASLGQSPEGCSSYIFPKIMGYGKAAEILIFGKKITAKEAYIAGLVTEVFGNGSLREAVDRIHEYSRRIVPSAAVRCKNSLREHHRNKLHQVNKIECDTLEKCWKSEEFFNSIMKFFSRRSKL